MSKRISMIKIRELLRLRFAAELSIRQIAHSNGLSIGVVSKYLSRAQALGLSWPLPEDLSDQALQAMMQPPRGSAEPSGFVEPDFCQVHQELKRKGMLAFIPSRY